jgi:membrane associated rhomboid family serine protease
MWVEVGRFAASREAEQHALVLVSVGVPSRLMAGATGTSLFVAEPDAAKARSEIAAYVRENSVRPVRAPALRPIREVIDGALIYAIVLVMLHAAATQQAFSVDWYEIGHAQATLIRNGEWWRTITALGLHADVQHLLSNIVAGGILGLLVAQLIGGGLAWLAILLCGAVGNTIVAYLAPSDHASIGASTSVFAALGLLAALAWGHQTIPWRGLRRWRPIGAAVMLLALLGVSGEHTDVGAHFAGLGAGLVGGVGIYLARDHLASGRSAQLLFGALAIGLFAAAWIFALNSA